jgi:hypothetical protein
VKKIITAGAAALALIAAALFSISPAEAALSVPKTPWPICSSARTSYCVESVSVTPVGGSPIALTWVPDGQVLTAPETSSVTSDSSTVLDTTTVITPSIPTVATGRSLTGRWTSLNWSSSGLDSLGYGGLYIEAKTANEFVNHVFVDVLPT